MLVYSHLPATHVDKQFFFSNDNSWFKVVADSNADDESYSAGSLRLLFFFFTPPFCFRCLMLKGKQLRQTTNVERTTCFFFYFVKQREDSERYNKRRKKKGRSKKAF